MLEEIAETENGIATEAREGTVVATMWADLLDVTATYLKIDVETDGTATVVTVVTGVIEAIEAPIGTVTMTCSPRIVVAVAQRRHPKSANRPQILPTLFLY